MLRIHIHPNNIDSVYKLLGKIKSELNSQYFTIYIKDVGHYGGKNDDSFEILGVNKNSDSLKADMYRSVEDFIRVSEEDFVAPCYAAKANAFMIRADGSVGKCTVALTSKRNSIGMLRDDGTFSLDNEKSQLWMHPLKSMVRSDLSCPLINLPSH